MSKSLGAFLSKRRPDAATNKIGNEFRFLEFSDNMNGVNINEGRIDIVIAGVVDLRLHEKRLLQYFMDS